MFLSVVQFCCFIFSHVSCATLFPVSFWKHLSWCVTSSVKVKACILSSLSSSFIPSLQVSYFVSLTLMLLCFHSLQFPAEAAPFVEMTQASLRTSCMTLVCLCGKRRNIVRSSNIQVALFLEYFEWVNPAGVCQWGLETLLVKFRKFKTLLSLKANTHKGPSAGAPCARPWAEPTSQLYSWTCVCVCVWRL